MTFRNDEAINDFDIGSVTPLNRSLDTLYKTRVESVYNNNQTQIKSHIYHTMETGDVLFSATGSATVTIAVGYKEKKENVFGAFANVQSTRVHAAVTNVTNSSMEITLFPSVNYLSPTTTGFSAISAAITTTQVRVQYLIIGNNP
jgi:hypothetical protein|tara:strand:- start:51 stop:485 length:435 start_codon:yes stop_codon:yes gene_type:complete